MGNSLASTLDGTPKPSNKLGWWKYTVSDLLCYMGIYIIVATINPIED